jgi:hypothetical protein
MPARAQAPADTPATINVVRFADPLVERVGHYPGSPYVELVWLGILGPSTTLAWQRLARQVAVGGPSTIDTADLAVSLGLGGDLGRNAMMSRTLARLVAFDAAHRDGDVLAVRVALPDLPERRLGRLSRSARLAHGRFSHVASTGGFATSPAEPGMVVGL